MEGGSYKRKRGEEPQRIGGTEPHPDGSRARDQDGAQLNGRVPPPPPTAEAEPAPAVPAELAAPDETSNVAAPAAVTDKGGAKRPPRKPQE